MPPKRLKDEGLTAKANFTKEVDDSEVKILSQNLSFLNISLDI